MKKQLTINNTELVNLKLDSFKENKIKFKLNDREYQAQLISNSCDTAIVQLGEKNFHVSFFSDQKEGQFYCSVDGANISVSENQNKLNISNQSEHQEGLSGLCLSPMPGKVLKVFVDVGDQVLKNQSLMVVEAMKMEHQIKAAFDGVVKKIHFKEGDQVEAKVLLVTITVKTDEE